MNRISFEDLGLSAAIPNEGYMQGISEFIIEIPERLHAYLMIDGFNLEQTKHGLKLIINLEIVDEDLVFSQMQQLMERSS